MVLRFAFIAKGRILYIYRMDIKNGDEIEMEEGFCYIHDKGGF